MEAIVDKSHVDLASAAGGVGDGSSRHSTAASDGGTENCSSTSSVVDEQYSNLSGNEIVSVLDKGRKSSASECSVEVVDLEAGGTVHLAKSERDCRICHLSFDATNLESGVPMELGCSCKDDLAAAHKQCAEAWFKIKGNKTCEICGSTARNVAGANDSELLEQWNEVNDTAAVGPVPLGETRRFLRGSRFLNFLLALMVFAFVISWLFHFNVPS